MVELGLRHEFPPFKIYVLSSDISYPLKTHRDIYTCLFACLFSFLITLPLYIFLTLRSIKGACYSLVSTSTPLTLQICNLVALNFGCILVILCNIKNKYTVITLNKLQSDPFWVGLMHWYILKFHGWFYKNNCNYILLFQKGLIIH